MKLLSALALAAVVVVAAAQDVPPGRRLALVVGVNEYDLPQFKTLDFAERDAEELAALLKPHDYAVTLMTRKVGGTDPTRSPTAKGIRARLADMLRGRTRNDLVIVALAGHGLQFTGEREAYFCPLDADQNRRDTLLSLTDVYAQLERCGAGVRLMLIDACRDDPQAGRGTPRGAGGGSVPPAPTGVSALYSCSPGERAFEHDKLRHGIFFHYVLDGLRGEAADRRGKVTWDALQSYVRQRVPDDVFTRLAGARQTPVHTGESIGAPPVLLEIKPTAGRADAKARPAGTNAAGMKFIRIPRGRFTMGSPPEVNRRADETQKEVDIDRAFEVGETLVTRGQFEKFVKATGHKTGAETSGRGGGRYDLSSPAKDGSGYVFHRSQDWSNPGFPQSDDHPVVMVGGDDSAAFCRWLSRQDRRIYRLPTEAEWEYACRAGTTTAFWCGNDPTSLRGRANVADDTFKKSPLAIWWPCAPWSDNYIHTSPVDAFPANPWGLRDMHGNVWQLCSDWYVANASRVIRGGSWTNTPEFCRSATRSWHDVKDEHYDNVGFRVVREVND